MEQQLVIFGLGEELFGVDIAAVESIIKMQELTRVPHTPSFVEGITNLRGAVLPVIDLRKRFKLPVVEKTKDSRIIVTNQNNVKVGMVVDLVSEVLTISSESVEPTPPMISSVDTAFIVGIAKIESRLVVLLNLERVLSENEQDKLQVLPANT
jgi:purine-binding chemotaxis protein CheW